MITDEQRQRWKEAAEKWPDFHFSGMVIDLADEVGRLNALVTRYHDRLKAEGGRHRDTLMKAELEGDNQATLRDLLNEAVGEVERLREGNRQLWEEVQRLKDAAQTAEVFAAACEGEVQRLRATLEQRAEQLRCGLEAIAMDRAPTAERTCEWWSSADPAWQGHCGVEALYPPRHFCPNCGGKVVVK